MLLRPETIAMTAALALLTSLGPLSTDMYLPSLPDIGTALRATPADVQLTLSAFLAGFALGQIVYGPVSDRYGRKPVLLASLVFYVVASAACALSPTIEWLIAARFVQALAACGAIVIARAIVRDLYAGPRAGQELARMGTIMGLVPALAPILGGFLHVFFGWQASFWATVLYGLTAVAVVALMLPETLKQRSSASLSPLGIAATFRDLLRKPVFTVHAMLFTLAYSGLFAFISGSSFVLQGLYGLTPEWFGAAFGFTVLGYISGSAVSARILPHYGVSVALGIGVACLAGGGILMATGLALGLKSPFIILLPMAIYTFGVGFTMPQAMAGALTPFPEKAGAASSLVGFMQMTCAAIVGIGVGHAIGSSAWPLALTVGAIGIAAACLYLATRRIRAGV